tara:strand:- start:569 stop:784 length:216 start_codon:yes stop_codon:yes gene_type:complete
MEDIIKKIIVENIPDAICLFEGDSCNLRLIVISSVFAEMPLINQHKKIMKLLEGKFQSGELHALSLETRTS